ncbi:hypothetical protein DAETH_25850 [Deinococcus aetherius]|uniref:Uncharacterized protein n=1 Tax=Deinococcus aetherius TaxID=200252 RepID=A0ABM8AFW6_9DEIO|nr:hypothetical protein DAETH_25850 [Deinococcus aetherius]
MKDQTRPHNLKLELTEVVKDHRPRLEPRLLLPDEERSCAAAARVGEMTTGSGSTARWTTWRRKNLPAV